MLAITSGVPDMGAVMNAAWDHLLPAMQADPLPAGATHGEIKPKLERLALPLAEGSATSPTARRVSGRQFWFEPNEEQIESATLTFKENRCRLTLIAEEVQHRIECAHNTWVKGTTALVGLPKRRVAASGAWSDADTYTLKLCYYETPFVQTITCRFEGDQVTLKRKLNVSFGPTERPALVGRAAQRGGKPEQLPKEPAE